MLDRIPERLRTAAEGVEKATQMMADAKSARNRAAGDVDASYSGLSKEQTAEWQAAAIIENLQDALRWLTEMAGYAVDHLDPEWARKNRGELSHAIEQAQTALAELKD